MREPADGENARMSFVRAPECQPETRGALTKTAEKKHFRVVSQFGGRSKK
jgi:hypothetical protein